MMAVMMAAASGSFITSPTKVPPATRTTWRRTRPVFGGRSLFPVNALGLCDSCMPGLFGRSARMTIYETRAPQATVSPPETAGALPIGDQGTEERGAESPFPIVGIGASAGGLEAFTQFLAHLPDQTGMALVLVQHLDPHHESRLTEILARSTHIPVLEATDGLEVCRDRVYVIPPNTNMAIAQGALRVTPRGEAHGPHLPIDHFLRALAEAQQAQAIGVVLSGTGSDGTLGLCEIKARGRHQLRPGPGFG
jgi:chemotaxis response regulator CheB